MYIPNDDTQKYPFCTFKLVVEACKHETLLINQSKVPKFVKPRNMKTLLKKLLGLVQKTAYSNYN